MSKIVPLTSCASLEDAQNPRLDFPGETITASETSVGVFCKTITCWLFSQREFR